MREGRFLRAPSADVAFQRSPDRNRIISLGQLDVAARADAVQSLGLPGLGKSPLPIMPGDANGAPRPPVREVFQLVNARGKKSAMVLTSNRGVAEWGEVFGVATGYVVNVGWAMRLLPA